MLFKILGVVKVVELKKITDASLESKVDVFDRIYTISLVQVILNDDRSKIFTLYII